VFAQQSDAALAIAKRNQVFAEERKAACSREKTTIYSRKWVLKSRSAD